MRRKLNIIRKRFKGVTDRGFSDLFERRDIVFVADGTDLNHF